MARTVDSMDKEAMQNASRAFKQGADTLQDIQLEIGKIANSLEQEIFQGDAGNAFGVALRQDLTRALQALQTHLNEISGDLTESLNKRVEAEQLAGRRFS